MGVLVSVILVLVEQGQLYEWIKRTYKGKGRGFNQ